MSKLGTTAKARREAGLLEAVRDAKAGRAARVYVPDGKGRLVRSEVARARLASGLTQQKFASLLGVSLRTLQEWEQGRKNPSGAARTLLKIAGSNPQALVAVADD
ncbi:MAG: helix-turn-helix domain-containing protein [Burkholderiales bacterium]